MVPGDDVAGVDEVEVDWNIEMKLPLLNCYSFYIYNCCHVDIQDEDWNLSNQIVLYFQCRCNDLNG